MSEIVMIPVDQLLHHPENPRKDLGDLTELADSIKSNGVLQNLTVVKVDEDTYNVVIGNRRMEAAKQAGLTEVPCVISEMEYKDQIATMLMENMQRQDLTVYEQAEGFQMMMDLGFKAKEIGEKTGFSEKTVKERLKLTKLNKKNFSEAVNQGATLVDMIEVTKLDSKTVQNEVLKAAGTENFRQKLKDALQEQEVRHNQERVLPILQEYSFDVMPEKERWSNHDWEQCYGSKIDIKDDEDAFRKAVKKFVKENREGPFRYFFTKWGGIEIYKPKSKAAKSPMSEEQKTERQKAIARGKHLKYVKGFWAQAYELRKDFVKAYTVTMGASSTTIGKIMIRYALNKETSYDGRIQQNHDWNDKYLREVLGLPEEPVKSGRTNPDMPWHTDYFTIWEQVDGKQEIPLVRVMLAWAVAGGVFWPDSPERGSYNNTDGTYLNGSNMESDVVRLYEFLKEIGYQMSDMEKQLLDGTHECYKMEGLE